MHQGSCLASYFTLPRAGGSAASAGEGALEPSSQGDAHAVYPRAQRAALERSNPVQTSAAQTTIHEEARPVGINGLRPLLRSLR
jgi:hypothetical protein